MHRHRNRWTANSEVSYYMFLLTTKVRENSARDRMVYFRSTFAHVSNNINKWKCLYQIGFYSVFCLKHGRDSLGNYYLIYGIYN